MRTSLSSLKIWGKNWINTHKNPKTKNHWLHFWIKKKRSASIPLNGNSLNDFPACVFILFFVLTSRRYAIIKRTSLFPSQSNGKIRNELAHYSGGCIKGYFHRRFHTRLQGKKYSKTVKNKQWPSKLEREKLSAIIRRRSRAYTCLKRERRRSFELKNSASILNFLAVKLTATALKSMGGDIIYVTKCGS